MYLVYIHTNKINGKKYIGITSKKSSQRFRNGRGYCSRFGNAIKKYGWNNFKHEILYNNLTRNQAEMIESELIKFYKTTFEKYGYNTYSGVHLKNKKQNSLIYSLLNQLESKNKQIAKSSNEILELSKIIRIQADYIKNRTLVHF